MNQRRQLDDHSNIWFGITEDVRECVWSGERVATGSYAVALRHADCRWPPAVIDITSIDDVDEAVRKLTPESSPSKAFLSEAATVVYHAHPSVSRLFDGDNCLMCEKTISYRDEALRIPCLCADGAIWVHLSCRLDFLNAINSVWEQSDVLLGDYL